MSHFRRYLRGLASIAVMAGLAGCGDLLEVQDPSRFTDEDLDAAPEAVAAGAEGDLHRNLDDMVYTSALLGDEFQHTGTWAQWDDVDHGRIRYDQSSTGDGQSQGILRARFTAQDARARFDRLASEGTNIPGKLYAQVEASEAWADLLLAENFCEAPGEAGGPAVSDMAIYQQAVTKFTAAIATASAAGETDYERWAIAGRARANLMLGNFADAANDAGQIPDGWSYEAIYTAGNVENAVVNLATSGFNNAGGMREKWWSRLDVAGQKLRDAFTDESDPRIPIRQKFTIDPTNGDTIPELGVDGVTRYYSQWKYTALGGPAGNIPFTQSEEMRLIEAEVFWQGGQLTQAMTILNNLRAAAGLSAVTATTSQEVFDVLLNERFAELFMEAQRTNDLYRFNLFGPYVTRGDFVGSIADRAIKFPMTSDEALNNSNIANDISARCSPTL